MSISPPLLVLGVELGREPVQGVEGEVEAGAPVVVGDGVGEELLREAAPGEGAALGHSLNDGGGVDVVREGAVPVPDHVFEAHGASVGAPHARPLVPPRLL